MPTRIVRNAIVRWEGDDGGQKWGVHGETIDVSQKVIDDLGDQLYPEGKGPADDDALQAAEAGTADASAGVPVDLDEGAVEDAAAWLRGDLGDKPKASEVVEAANGDADRAQLLIEAEGSLDGDPRKTVIDPLQKIIEGSGS